MEGQITNNPEFTSSNFILIVLRSLWKLLRKELMLTDLYLEITLAAVRKLLVGGKESRQGNSWRGFCSIQEKIMIVWSKVAAAPW